MGKDFDSTMQSIKDVIIKTLLSVESPIVAQMSACKHKQACFEIYGFDILIDAKLKPWLLEVNVSPSLSSSSTLDKHIKTLLLSDSMYLVGFKLFNRKTLEQEKAKIDKQRLLGFESNTTKSSKKDQDPGHLGSPYKVSNQHSSLSVTKTFTNPGG